MRIFYFPGSDHPLPSGGFKTHYRHVEQLRALGYDAHVLQLQPGWRPGWFESTAPIAYAGETPLFSDDVLVVNEITGPYTQNVFSGRIIVFNQNCHYTFRGYPTPPTVNTATPYRAPNVIGTLTLTDYCRDALKMAFPQHPIHVVPHGIDPAVFPLGTAKKKQIAYMPRKHADEAQAVFGYLRYMGVLDGWDVVAIDGQSERDASRILGESLVFFGFGYPEGGTLPPFEAMAAGCVYVGYGGYASDELLRRCGLPAWAVVPSGNSIEFAKRASYCLDRKPEALAEDGKRLSAMTLKVLSMDGERRALKAAMESLL